jgi:hypothetical protein
LPPETKPPYPLGRRGGHCGEEKNLLPCREMNPGPPALYPVVIPPELSRLSSAVFAIPNCYYNCFIAHAASCAPPPFCTCPCLTIIMQL